MIKFCPKCGSTNLTHTTRNVGSRNALNTMCSSCNWSRAALRSKELRLSSNVQNHQLAEGYAAPATSYELKECSQIEYKRHSSKSEWILLVRGY